MLRLNQTHVIIAAGAIVLGLGFGARSIFGIVLDPISTEFGWPREIFSLSLAIQNLTWGFAQPIFGMIADRMGDRKALWLGFGLYLAGMLLSATGYEPWMQHLGAGVLVGLGVSGTGFGLVLSAVGRGCTEANRTKVMATTAALGSLGQMLMPLIAGWVTAEFGWQATLFVVTALLLPMALCIPFLGPQALPADHEPEAAVAIGPLLAHAFAQPSYILLMFGFFVCGFHVGFMTAHLPAYVAEVCGSVTLGAAALSIVGGANVIGTYAFGSLGSRYPKPYVLSLLYAVRALVMMGFILIPATPLTVIIFAATVGLAWLATVPLTSALVASIFGPKYMATLYGFVFLAHQLGAFAGVWMGGRMYDLYGNYQTVWWAAIGLGVFSALVHLPVSEQRVRMQVA
ncbi:MAG TPA: MFS transporter [Thermohalobaculum sp.]|nr:MFS transporter [Thermohalobaculum sp.]